MEVPLDFKRGSGRGGYHLSFTLQSYTILSYQAVHSNPLLFTVMSSVTVSAKKLPPVTRLQAKTMARMRAEVRPKILEPKRQTNRLSTLKQDAYAKRSQEPSGTENGLTLKNILPPSVAARFQEAVKSHKCHKKISSLRRSFCDICGRVANE